MKMKTSLIKFRPYILLLLFFAVGVFAYTQTTQAINTPKQVYGTVANSDTSTPGDTDVTFKAYIQTRPAEQLTQASTGCAYGLGFYQVELSAFTTQWAGGDVLVVEFTNSANNEKKTINVTLDGTPNPQLVNVTLQPKVLQNIVISAPANSIAVGETLQFTATGTYDDTSTENITDSVTWTVTPTPAGAAAFDATVKGRLNGLAPGTGVVKASKSGVDSSEVSGTVTAFNGTVAVAAAPTSIVANGTSTSTITATVKTAGNVNVVDGVSVAFAVSAGTGTVAPASATTANGVATATYTSSITAGSGTVTATVGATSGNATVTLTPGTATKIVLTAEPATISCSVASESTLTARILDTYNNLTNSTAAVTFSVGATTYGDIKSGETTVNATAGVATSHLVSTVDPTGGAIAVTATSAGLTNGTATVTTAPKILQSIAIETTAGGKVNTTSPKVGETVQFKATGTYQDPSTQEISTADITTSVTWASSDPAKGTIGPATGLFSAVAEGSTNVTAALGGKTSNAVAMNVQPPAAVVIDTTDLPTETTLTTGTVDVGAHVTGGTGDGFNYSITSGPTGGAISAAGVFTAGGNAGEYTITVQDKTSLATSTYKVKVPITLTPKAGTILGSATQAFTVNGAGTTYTWEIMDSLTATAQVTTPADYGTWTKASPVTDDNTNTFTPTAGIDQVKTFYVRVTVADDPDLTEENALNKKTFGPFNITPTTDYTVNVKKPDGTALSGATVSIDYTGKAPVVTGADGKAVFTGIASTGGKYLYEVMATGYVSQKVSSSESEFDVKMTESDTTIGGTVTNGVGGPGLVGATVSAYLPATPTAQYQATTIAGGVYAINLPTGAAATGWTVAASMTGFVAGSITDIAGGATTANIALSATAVGSPDTTTAGGEKTVTASGQTVDVEVPAGGVGADGYIMITPAPKDPTPSNYTSASPTNVWEVTITDAAGTPLADNDINHIIITIPVDLGVVKPGDLENGVAVIYHAETQAALEAGSGAAVPVGNIISTDYVGDGQIGSVTFWVEDLSFFGIGIGGGGLIDSSGDSRCFIATAAFGSPYQKYVETLRKFRDVYLLTNNFGRKAVDIYYQYSPGIASAISHHEGLKASVRVMLMPIIGISYLMLHFGGSWVLLALFGLTAGLITTAVIIRRRKLQKVEAA